MEHENISDWLMDRKARGEYVYYRGFMSKDFPNRIALPEDCRIAYRQGRMGFIHLYQRRMLDRDLVPMAAWEYCAKKSL